MNENTIHSFEENTTETTTENINTNTDISVEDKQSTTDLLPSNDNIALAYDYYDHYYDEVTKSLSEISSRENTIINNQEILIDKTHSLNTTCSCFTFIVTIIFVYTLIRNMIIVK